MRNGGAGSLKLILMLSRKRNRTVQGAALSLGAIALLAFVSLPAGHAQLGADAAHVASVSGRVSVERGAELWTVAAGQTILAGQVIVTGPDGSAQLILSDASTL